MKKIITERALIQRLNRRLVRDDARLVKLRGKRIYYTTDTHRNTIIHKTTDLGHYAREIGALNDYERLETSPMTTKTKKAFKSKEGVEIQKGELVTLTFNVKSKSGKYLPRYVRMTTEDGRSISTANFKAAGLRIPSLKQLEYWAFDSVCESVFGNTVEPDGWDSEGSPSWLLALGLISESH